MKESNMYLLNKLFEGKDIRMFWNKDEEKYYISVVDVVGILTDSENPRNYWKVLKHRLIAEKNETVTNCNRLKLKSKDGKYRLTDVTDIEGIFRIIESIPSKKAEPIKMWLARLGKERINETIDPSISIQRAIDNYRLKGYDEEWIIKRIKGIQDRKKLTDVWNENGVIEPREYAILTNILYKEWSGMDAKEYKEFKGLKKESLRDNMSDLEVLLSDISEISTRELAKKYKPYGLEENKKVAKTGGSIANDTRKNIESKLGEQIVTTKNNSKMIDVN